MVTPLPRPAERLGRVNPSVTDLPSDPASDDGISRRSLLRRSAAAGAGVVLTGSVSGLFGTGTGTASARSARLGYGPLIPDPRGLLALPEGFSYEVIARTGQTRLSTGELSPSDPDAAVAFVRRGGNGSVIVLNHEVGGSEPHPVPRAARLTYNPRAGGGCTIIEVDKHGRTVSHAVGLAGTLNNCAGGRTPWATWITCEETESLSLGKPHGYCFEVDPYDQDRNLDPKPIKALGRFAHESVVVDPSTGRIYETEDAGNPNGLLYRWTPPASAGTLGTGVLRGLADDAGTLEAMQASTAAGTVVGDLSGTTGPGTTYKVKWLNVPDRDAKTVSTRKQAYAGPVTRSRKLEGMWWGDGGAYFVCSFARTSDGSVGQHDGQVWFLDPKRDTIELRLHFAYTPADQDTDPDGPDNITVSAHGGLIIAEDGDGRQHLVGATDKGETFFFARNEEGDSEFAGPCFSVDGKTLFASIQSPGITFAITGPFKKQGR